MTRAPYNVAPLLPQGAASSLLSVKELSVVAATPVAVCFLVPLIQIKDIVYLYDLVTIIALGFLGFPRVRHPLLRRFEMPWMILCTAIIIGFGSAVARGGITIRSIGYSTQFLLALTYCRCLVLNIVAGRIEVWRVASSVAYFGAAAAGLGILQFLLLQTNAALADQLYSAYLNLANYDVEYYERTYQRIWRVSGQTRIVGTWSVTTTYGGMMVLAAAWLMLTRWAQPRRLLFWAISYTAALMTLSRHAWVIGLVVLVGLLIGTKRAAAALLYLLLGIGLVVVLIAVLSFGDVTGGWSDTDFSAQLQSRVDGTIEQGFANQSLQARYVAGTLRFFLYALNDPSILIIGFGIQTEAGLRDAVGPDGLQYGYVSNGWLLIWRNCGILGIIGLAMLHTSLLRMAGSAVIVPLAVLALIFLSDNYPVHTPSPFFLLMVFIGCLWGNVIRETMSADTEVQGQPAVRKIGRPERRRGLPRAKPIFAGPMRADSAELQD